MGHSGLIFALSPLAHRPCSSACGSSTRAPTGLFSFLPRAQHWSSLRFCTLLTSSLVPFVPGAGKCQHSTANLNSPSVCSNLRCATEPRLLFSGSEFHYLQYMFSDPKSASLSSFGCVRQCPDWEKLELAVNMEEKYCAFLPQMGF